LPSALSSTRQKNRSDGGWNGDGHLPRAWGKHSAKIILFAECPVLALGKASALCRVSCSSTRQRAFSLPSFLFQHSAKLALFAEC
jgi:hypothetical protein